MTVKDMIKPVVVLSLVCLVIVAALAFTYQFTKPFIDQAKAEAAARAMREVFPGEFSFEEVSTLPQGDGIVSASVAKDAQGQTVGAVVTTATRGYGGEIQVMTGVDAAGKVTGVKLLEHSETPGLGAKAAKPDFTNRFIGVEPAEVDVISGSTVTSTAMKNAVTNALQAAATLLPQEGGAAA